MKNDLAGRRVHPLGPGGKEDLRTLHHGRVQGIENRAGQGVVHHRLAFRIQGHPVFRHRLIQDENQDHLQTGKRLHELRVFGAETDEVFGGDEREVHADFEEK